MSEDLFLDRVDTPIGKLLLVADARGRLRMLEFADKPERWRPEFKRRFAGETMTKTANPFGLSRRLADYFRGDVAALDSIKTDCAGTEFQRAVWAMLRRIPVGSTTSYGLLARRLGKPQAMRAVGLANGANPIAVVVPCHRVVGSDGSLTGYGGGIARKRWLLDHEARHSQRTRKAASA
ncbi:MAG TPA: methylated-DNA--[protein]-cysteine S-methyltransferase [Rhizomicrobium sp.]|nr:methylated-DNA--[protein]-cysteine S-methyltransferase [Rhizomicrobium sp.]